MKKKDKYDSIIKTSYPFPYQVDANYPEDMYDLQIKNLFQKQNIYIIIFLMNILIHD